MRPGLFDRLGGAPGVAAIVDDAVDRQAANPLLAPRWRGHDLPQLKALGVQWLTAAADGPPPDGGPPGAPVALWVSVPLAGLAALRLSDAERRAVAEALAAALAENGVSAADAAAVQGLLRAAPWTAQPGTNEEHGRPTLPSAWPDGGSAPTPRRSLP